MLRLPGVLLLCVASLLAACVHGPAPHVPPHAHPTARVSPDADSGGARLQIVIAYGRFWCNHAALRLVAPERPDLFWDPGGGYGTEDPAVSRHRDLVIGSAPDLARYLEYAWSAGGHTLEVFEWELTPDRARRMHDQLVAGPDHEHAEGPLYTNRAGLECALAISDFLRRFAADLVSVRERFFFPHGLSRVLWAGGPDQVRVFVRDERIEPRVLNAGAD